VSTICEENEARNEKGEKRKIQNVSMTSKIRHVVFYDVSKKNDNVRWYPPLSPWPLWSSSLSCFDRNSVCVNCIHTLEELP
jgi:hypothetical protein